MNQLTKHDIIEIAVRVLGLALIGWGISQAWLVLYFYMHVPEIPRNDDGTLSYFIYQSGFTPLYDWRLIPYGFSVLLCLVTGFMFARYAPWFCRVMMGLRESSHEE